MKEHEAFKEREEVRKREENKAEGNIVRNEQGEARKEMHIKGMLFKSALVLTSRDECLHGVHGILNLDDCTGNCLGALAPRGVMSLTQLACGNALFSCAFPSSKLRRKDNDNDDDDDDSVTVQDGSGVRTARDGRRLFAGLVRCGVGPEVEDDGTGQDGEVLRMREKEGD